MFFLQHRNELRCNRMIHVEAFEAFLLGQVSEERLRVVTAYIALLEHLECNAIVDLAEFLDFFIGSRILFIELVAREAEDFQTLVLVFLVQFLKSGKLRCESAFACGIGDQKNLAFILRERNFLALHGGACKIINAHCVSSLYINTLKCLYLYYID